MMKINYILILCMITALSACSSKKVGASGSKKPLLSRDGSYFVMTDVSSDTSYGFTERNPVKVGYNGSNNGHENERKFLNGLRGPHGEKISYSRIGSCCFFANKKLAMGGGLLDKYRVKWSEDDVAEDKEIVLYINMYEYEHVMVPAGLSVRK